VKVLPPQGAAISFSLNWHECCFKHRFLMNLVALGLLQVGLTEKPLLQLPVGVPKSTKSISHIL
jgi:hypothetical protein